MSAQRDHSVGDDGVLGGGSSYGVGAVAEPLSAGFFGNARRRRGFVVGAGAGAAPVLAAAGGKSLMLVDAGAACVVVGVGCVVGCVAGADVITGGGAVAVSGATPRRPAR